MKNMKRSSQCALLFGGALFCAGMQAGAQVSDASVEFSGYVHNLFEFGDYVPGYGYPYVDTGVSESFDVQGDLSLLPFSQTARGGVPNAYTPFFLQSTVTAAGSGSLSPAGELAFQGSAFASNNLLFPADPPLNNNRSSGGITFTIDSPGEFAIEVLGFDFDNDFGSAGLSLVNMAGGTVYSYSGFTDPTIGTGVLQPGSYELSFGASGQGSISVDFSVIPAPPTALLCTAGLFLARRRR